jgi:hypothetical protein
MAIACFVRVLVSATFRINGSGRKPGFSMGFYSVPFWAEWGGESITLDNTKLGK